MVNSLVGEDAQVGQSINSGYERSWGVVIVLLLVGFLTSFGAGFLMRDLLGNEWQTTGGGGMPIPTPSTAITPTITTPVVTPVPISSTQSGESYLNETIIALAKDGSLRALVGTVIRDEQPSGFVQNTRVSWYDGEDWNRKVGGRQLEDSVVVPDGIVRSWSTEIDSSRVLRERVSGEFNLNGLKVNFQSDWLENEMGVRSLPGYTKFMSQGEGTMSMDGETIDVYLVYSRIYSMDSSQIQFYDDHLGLQTDWLVFWDDQGHFYHIDKTMVESPTNLYEDHEFGIWINELGGVYKSFQVDVMGNNEVPPMTYEYSLGSHIDDTISVKVLESFNKAGDTVTRWYIGQVEGEVIRDGQTFSGVGLAEFVRE